MRVDLFSPQVRNASVGDPGSQKYPDWHGVVDLSEYMTSVQGEEPSTVDTYCEEALMDRRGSLQISRWGLSCVHRTPAWYCWRQAYMCCDFVVAAIVGAGEVALGVQVADAAAAAGGVAAVVVA